MNRIISLLMISVTPLSLSAAAAGGAGGGDNATGKRRLERRASAPDTFIGGGLAESEIIDISMLDKDINPILIDKLFAKHSVQAIFKLIEDGWKEGKTFFTIRPMKLEDGTDVSVGVYFSRKLKVALDTQPDSVRNAFLKMCRTHIQERLNEYSVLFGERTDKKFAHVIHLELIDVKDDIRRSFYEIADILEIEIKRFPADIKLPSMVLTPRRTVAGAAAGGAASGGAGTSEEPVYTAER